MQIVGMFTQTSWFGKIPALRAVGAVASMLSASSFLNAADGDSELHITSDVTTINDVRVITGEAYALTVGDVAYESDTQRNAVVVNGGELQLVNGADLWVKNDDNHTTFIRVGYGSSSAGNGTLTIQSGATFRVGSATRYANFQLGQGSGVTGTVNQSGGDATFIGSVNVGVNGGTGIYNVSGGTVTFDNAGPDAVNKTSLVSIGFNNSATGTSNGQFNISGGLVTVNAPHDGGGSTFIIGNAALNALQAYSGTADNNNNSGDGNGTVTQTGGIFRIGSGATLFLSAYGNGTYNLNGGTLEVGGDSLQAQYGGLNATYSHTFNLGGGTIQVTGSDLITSVNANLIGGATSKIDTNGLNATWSGNLTGAGLHQIDDGGSSLQKIGTGTLTFNGTGTRVLDTFAALVGTTEQTAGATSAVEFLVGSGSGSTATYTLSGGTLTINNATKANGTTVVAGSFRVGDFGGTGTFNQSGGTVDVSGSMNIGNQSGQGTYNLSGGTLNLGDAGLSTLGRTSGSNVANGGSTGVLNVSGTGVLNIVDGANLVLSNWYPSSGITQGNGTLTQTGGVINVDNTSALTLTGLGTGTYNLNGGTLQIGAASLVGIFGGQNGAYNFNLGGGTIKVTGADLVTSVNANLVAATTSVIDTGALNATWSGNLTAAGLRQIDNGGSSLQKIGTGTLTFSGAGARVLDTFAVLQGTVAQSAGATSSVEMMVGSGPGSTATYNLSGGTLTLNDSIKGTNTPVVASFRVGDFGGTGTFNQTGGTVNTPALNVGNQGGNGTYNLSGGTLNLNSGLSTLGRTSGGTAANGGSVGLMTVSGSGRLNVNAGAELVLSNWSDHDNASQGSGTLTQTGGVIHVDNAASFKMTGWGTGTYNLNGGTLEIGGNSLIGVFFGEAGTYNFNFGAGTIKVIGSNLDTAINANLTATKVSTIDTNGFDANWAGNITSAGLHQIDYTGSSLIKTGLGTLTFSGTGSTTRVLDTFAVTGGLVAQTAGTTSAVEMMVGSGVGSTATYNLSSGTLLINASTLADNTTPVSGSFRVGDFSGTGTFNQSGGSITVANNSAFTIGNQGGSGTYNLSGGTLTLNSGNHVLGRSTGTKAASTGVMTVSGGTLILDNDGHLILGNNITDATNFGTGTLTQTGGTIRVLNGGLYVGASGNGTYNLNGGTLELTGTGLYNRYSGAGTSTFNFGGGTIKSIGTGPMTTGVNANLVAGATSIIDTNGIDTTFSGNLIGTGTRQIDDGGNRLAKIGIGTLYLSGATRTLDTFVAAVGTTRQTAGATSVSEFMVGSGVGSIGTFEMAGGTLLLYSGRNAGNTADVPGSFRVGDYSGTGTFTQTGGTITVGDSSADSDAALTIGNQGGNGTYNLNGGTLSISGGNSVIARSTGLIGEHGTSTGELNISGASTLLEITDGSALINGNNTIGRSDGNATINQSGGTVRVTSGTLSISAFSAGTYNFTGGTIEVGGNGLKAHYNTSTATSTFNFGAGTIKVIGSDLTTDLISTLTAGATSTVNTNAFNATFSGTFDSAGLHTALYGGNTFAKTGTGTLLFSGTTREFDTLNVAAGTARQASNTTTALELKVGSGASVTSTYEMAGGTLNLNASTQTDGTTAVAGALIVGDAAGTGTFTQTAGTVTVGSTGNGELLIGREGGNGTYTLSGGTLKLSGGTNVLSRSNATHTASTAVLNISGASVLELLNGASLILGNDVSSGGATGSAVLTQTGGTLRLTNGSLYIAGYGAGTYNLSGGTLEVGGSSLSARYGSSVATSTFNFGTATLKVIGSDLTTDVRANLVDTKIATINTNGFNATFSNGFTGTGGFAKTGVGALTLNGTTALSADSTVSGVLKVGAGDGQTGQLDLTDNITVTVAGTAVGRLQVGVDGGTGTANFNTGSSFTINDASKTTGYGTLDVGRGDGSTGTVNHSSGTVELSHGALQIGYTGGTGTYHLSGTGELSLSGSDSSLFIGSGLAGGGLLTIAGTSEFSSAGQVLIGSGTGTTGTITQSGGTATFSGASVWFGTVSDETPATAGTGIYNLSGGTVTFNSINQGVRFGADVTGGAGQFNQSGGTATFNSTTLTIGANGTYNLTGGTIEVGGTNLSGTGAYNLGNGTIKVIGSNLTAAANAALTSGAITTVNTNALNATFTGTFTAAGLHTADFGGHTFLKSGTGALSFTNAGIRTFDTFALTAGTAGQTTGTTNALEFNVINGTTYALSGGTLAIKASTEDDDSTAVTGTLLVGDAGTAGTFTQSAGAVTIGSAGGGELLIGREGGSGTYTLSGGTLTISGGRTVLSRSSATHTASTAALNISGAGTLLELTNGAALILGNDVSSGGATGSAVLTQTAGTLRVTAGALYIAGYGAGTYNLNGGTLEVGGNGLAARYGSSVAASTFNFGTATIKVIGSDLVTDVNTTLAAGAVSTINTNSLGATFSGTFASAGLHNATYGGNTLVKSGAGALSFTGATRTLDTFNLNAGTAGQTAGNTTALEFNIANGTTFTLGGGSLAINSSTQVNGTTAVTGALNIVTGTFEQTAGAVTLGGTDDNAALHIGRDGGTGVYELSGGTLTLAGGVNDLGYTTGGSAGSGTLNLSGGLVELTDATAALVLGDTDGAGAQGTGTLNQTDGILRVTTGGLWLSSRGNGTYNLDGGTLEVGGGNLHTFYTGAGTGTGTYAFNLGGGTIKVIGSALTTDANMTLKTGSVSTINTNTFGATLSGVLTGAGGLTKSGLGVLRLTADSSYSGATTVEAGTFRVDGILANTVITVGTGATLTGGGGAKSVIIQDGGSFAVGGDTPGVFTASGDITLAENSQTLLEIAGLASYDSLNITGTLFAGGDLHVSFINDFTAVEGNSFTLFTAGAINGTFENLWLPTLTAGLEWDTSTLYTDGDISVEASAVPEPATWAALFGGAALATAGLRRRRRV